MDVECVSFKRRAAYYFPIPVRACFSLSLSAVFLAVSMVEK